MVKALAVVIGLLMLALAGAGITIKYLHGELVVAEASVTRYQDTEKRNAEAFAAELKRLTDRNKDLKDKHDAEIAVTLQDLEAAKRQRNRERATADRLRIDASICKAGRDQGSEGVPAGRSDDPEGIVIPEEVERRLRDLADEANRNTDQLTAAQGVIRACYKRLNKEADGNSPN
jgi:hypothetical protein